MKKHKKLSFLLVIIITLASFKIYQKRQVRDLIVYPKGNSYEKEWKKVDSLGNRGLTQSALKVIEEIYNKAKKTKNSPQLVKAVIHRLKYRDQREEKAFIHSVDEIKNEIKSASYPLKNVFHSTVAEMYWWYYQRNRWQIMQRSETIDFENNDIETWDLKRLSKEISFHYNQSLLEADKLQRTPAKTFEDILISGVNSEKLRPMLFDLLAYRAIDFYKHGESGLSQAADQFKLDDRRYLSSHEMFVKIDLTPYEKRYPNSLKIKTLKLWQALITAHQQDHPSSLIHADLQRLKFAQQNTTLANKDELYYNALKTLSQHSDSLPETAEVIYEMAQFHFQQGSRYQPLESEDFRWGKKKAIELCNQAIKKWPKSYGAGLCQDLSQQIQNKFSDLKIERVNPVNQSFKGLLTYNNLKTVYLRIVKIKEEDVFLNRRMNNQQLLNYYMNLPVDQEWTQQLENDGDFQKHSVQLKFPALEFGQYTLLISQNGSFKSERNILSAANFWISNLSFISSRKDEKQLEFYVFNRKSGQPINGAKVLLFKEAYNYIKRENESEEIAELVTNKNGKAIFTHATIRDNYKYVVSHQKDKLSNQRTIYLYGGLNNNEPRKYIRTHFFTDRSIYRPGQTLYFKGIVIESDGKNNEIKPQQTVTVTLYDANNQKVSDVKLTTNEFGTYGGSFTLPSGGLNGRMYIGDGFSNHQIQVEEYKRPKFEVIFDPIKGTYKLNENINTSGKAISYSGANVDGAKVNYRVVRSARFPYFYGWGHHGYFPRSPQVEVTNGFTTTDDNGKYTISFKAVADENLESKYHPLYTYTIHADVTDINGETHSASQFISVGTKALLISANISNQLNLASFHSFHVNSTNLNGVFEAAKGQIKIWQLEHPNQYYRPSLWTKADRKLMTKENFQKNFPHDPYDHEDDIRFWKKKKLVFDRPFNTADTTIIHIPDGASLSSGQYIVELTSKDKFGSEVKWSKNFLLYSSQSKEVPSNQIDWFVPLKASGEPGETASFLIGSKAPNVKILYEVEHKQKVVHTEWVELNNSQQKIEIPIEEKHRGNFSVNFLFVKHGRIFQHSQTITVPFTNKMLDVQFETFRDKLLPGEKEEWSILIKDKTGQKAAAEMVATLYDASLDAFLAHHWGFNIHRYNRPSISWNGGDCFNSVSSRIIQYGYSQKSHAIRRTFDRLNWFNYSYHNTRGYPGMRLFSEKSESMDIMANGDMGAANEESPTIEYKQPLISKDPASPPEPASIKKSTTENSTIPIRSNFNETAFFYPQLATNEKGEIKIKFTLPESLTRWKMFGFAHSKDLKYGFVTQEILAQKDLMISSNPPRFFREGDQLHFSAKISNISDETLTGEANIDFFNAMNGKKITSELLPQDEPNTLSFMVNAKQSKPLKWSIRIPDNVQAISYKITAQSGSFSDGEEMIIPVLTNKMLVTESLPLPIKGSTTKKFEFKKLKQASSSSSLKHERLTLEYTSNPAWYAVQALPYLMEYPYDCAEQVFSKFYANSMANHIANSSPKIKQVFDTWKNISPNALRSNLEKNQELKSLLLQETPWVMQAKNETERKKRVGLLFDINKMSNELRSALQRLIEMQSGNGGWPWFKGMPESRYITQHIVCGMGHLDHLKIKEIRQDNSTFGMIQKAVQYLDSRIREDYEHLKRQKVNLSSNHLGSTQIQYLYARSYFQDIAINPSNKEAIDYYREQAEKYWLSNNQYLQGMIALSLNRVQKKEKAKEIMASLKENALLSEEMGMYWKSNNGYYWYQAPIEKQALLIEAFDEITNDQNAVEEMKVWLLKQKQTQDWKTTKATTEACYALLLKGTDLLENNHQIIIQLGNQKIDSDEMSQLNAEAGTGYFKKSWNENEITAEMGNISVSRKSKDEESKNSGASWGALYWQYFEQLDKITPHETPLKLKKQLFVERNTNSGPVIEPLNQGTLLNVGDKVKVRIELRVDRNMEYVHMKDMRASGMEPIQVISGYRFQDGLGYYQSTKDASTNFFFDYLRKGTYVFEYPLRANIAGDFSNGITSIQSMYAPEFTSHSEGVRITIDP